MTDLFTLKTTVYGPRLMRDLLLTETQAAGIFGNIGHECAGFVHMQEIQPTVAGSAGGYGWCQWTGPRRRQFESYCKLHNLRPESDEANYGYLIVELRGSEIAALSAVRKTVTLAQATERFCAVFERPGVINLQSRLKWSVKALDAIRISPKPEPVAVTQPGKPDPIPVATIGDPVRETATIAVKGTIDGTSGSFNMPIAPPQPLGFWARFAAAFRAASKGA